MKVRRRIKRTTRQYIIVALICIVVIGGAAVITSVILTSQIREEYNQQLSEVYNEKVMNQRNVYVAAGDIMKGDLITADNVKKMTVYSSQPEETYMGEDGLGKAALLDIPEGTHLQNNMLTEMAVTSELREVEYDVINVNTNILVNDTVDVRIFYPNGESYVVLTKKLLKGYNPETLHCFFWVDEEELLLMSAAIVDAGLYPGSRIYVTKYIEPIIQEASCVNYTPSLSILSLIESDPNIIHQCSQQLNMNIRKTLENRLAASMSNDVTSISWDVQEINEKGLTQIKEEESEAERSQSTIDPVPTTDLNSDGVDYGKNSWNQFFVQEEEDKESDIEYGE